MAGIIGWMENYSRKYEDTLRTWNGLVHRDDVSKAMVHGILTQDKNNNKYKNSNKYNYNI